MRNVPLTSLKRESIHYYKRYVFRNNSYSMSYSKRVSLYAHWRITGNWNNK